MRQGVGLQLTSGCNATPLGDTTPGWHLDYMSGGKAQGHCNAFAQGLKVYPQWLPT